jgi:hypothetical protein
MFCKVACRTANGYWFFWDNQLFSTPEGAYDYISKQKDYIKGDLFLVYPSKYGWKP